MKLYEINEQLQQLLDNGYTKECIDIETGEIDEAKAQELLSNLNIEFSEKVEGIGCYIKDLANNEANIKAEIDRLKSRKEATEKKKDSLKQYISDILLQQNKDKFETSRVAISFRKSTVVEILNMESIPNQYIKQEIKETVDKKEIKKAFKSGIVIDGACLIETKNIQIK